MLLVLDITVPGPKIRFKRPRFRLKCVLNSIVIPAAQLLSFAGLSCCAQPALSGGPGGPWPLADARGPAIEAWYRFGQEGRVRWGRPSDRTRGSRIESQQQPRPPGLSRILHMDFESSDQHNWPLVSVLASLLHMFGIIACDCLTCQWLQ